MKRSFLVTTALPYANGPFHIGHIMEYIQADIWVRTRRMQGHDVHFVCADDAHGAPIMIKAEKEGTTPEALVASIAAGRPQYLNGFHIAFDHWHCSHSPENEALASEIYLALRDNGFIYTKTIEQYFDPQKEMFLPDRFIKGTCPKCDADDQYGDSCEQCGAVYAPTELKNPFSALTKTTPVLKASEHYFFKLSDPRCVEFLKQWTSGKNTHGEAHLQNEVLAKMQEWLGTNEENNMSDWDISRDAPYFGIRIPETENKYFYVWLDAPVGYLASFKAYCQKQGWDFDTLIQPDSPLEQVHFIGKDITYFHTLFWPAMLQFSGRKTPTQVNTHGFMTVNGEKMSKSRGTGIDPLRYLDIGLDAEWLRYYLAAKLNQRVEDIDFNPEDFVARINSDLIGKYINIASRSSNFIRKHFDGQLNYHNTQDELLQGIKTLSEQAVEYFEQRDYARALRLIMAYADEVNQAFDTAQPWVLAKEIKNATDLGLSDVDTQTRMVQLQTICSRSLASFKAISVLLSPVLPALAQRITKDIFLNEGQWLFKDALELPTYIQDFKHLMTRVKIEDVEKLFDAPVAEPTPAPKKKKEKKVASTKPNFDPNAPGGEPIAPEISFDEFSKMDLRVGHIQSCDYVEGSNKLYRLMVDIGEEKPRQIFSGIQNEYKPEDLIGQHVVIVANLAPRKMRFGVSEGMILCAEHADTKNNPGTFVLLPWEGAKAGMKIC